MKRTDITGRNKDELSILIMNEHQPIMEEAVKKGNFRILRDYVEETFIFSLKQLTILGETFENEIAENGNHPN